MPTLLCNLNDKTGRKIRPLHGMNSGPCTKVFTYDSSKQYRDLGIPYCRLHDVEYPYGSGEFVDIPCIFKDFDADETKPESYNFALTDEYLKAIINVGSEPLFRLGVSIEHPATYLGIARYTAPPKDFSKWARICEHIIRHYTEGWADGFRWNVTYWEIWNEPDGSQGFPIGHRNMWQGDAPLFAEFYTVAARHLKKCFPHLKIGGAGFTTSRNPFIDAFFACLAEENERSGERVPMDFYSWHRYAGTSAKILRGCLDVRPLLEQYGYGDAESIFDEWNYMEDWNNQPESYVRLKNYRGAAFCASVLALLQSETDVTAATYFEGDPIKEWCGIMDVNTMRIGRNKAYQKPLPPYYAFKCFNELYKLRDEVPASVDTPDVHVCAAENSGVWGILAGNDTDEDKTVFLSLSGFNPAGARVMITDETRNFEPLCEGIPDFIVLPAHSFAFISNIYGAEISGDFSEGNVPVRPLHGVNQGPMTKVFTYDASPQFRELGIPFCRLHDTEYPYGSGEFVDIPNLFKNFDADENDPSNYDFALTDAYIEKIYDAGAEPLFRLGVSIEHAPTLAGTSPRTGRWDKFTRLASRINPPADFSKWARICEHVIRHYTEGWADGFNYKLSYWEIWNEPEGDSQWTGTPEEAYRLYAVTARHLKKCFPELKIGGCGFTRAENSFITGFFRYLRSENDAGRYVPLDFFSWHCYSEFSDYPVHLAKIARAQLDRYGYPDAENVFDEWNFSDAEGALTGERFRVIKDYRGAAFCASVLAAIQNDTDVSLATYFEADVVKEWCGLFDVDQMTIGAHGHKATVKPLPPYYAFKAFNELYKLGHAVKLTVNNPCVRAAAASDGSDFGILAANDRDKSFRLNFTLENLPAGIIAVYLTDEEHTFELVPADLREGIVLPPHSFVYITNRPVE